jgi:hypothetical protein
MTNIIYDDNNTQPETSEPRQESFLERYKYGLLTIIIIAFTAGLVVGWQYPVDMKDCQQDYNRGYGDALYYALEHQRMARNYGVVNYSNISLDFNRTNMTAINVSSYYVNNFNITPNMTMRNDCYENETGYDPNDLVMHMQCKRS